MQIFQSGSTSRHGAKVCNRKKKIVQQGSGSFSEWLNDALTLTQNGRIHQNDDDDAFSVV